MRRLGQAENVCQIVAFIAHPATDEHVLVLPQDWSGQAQHHIHPRSTLLGKEGGTRAILAIAISYGIVDHEDLAMIA